MGTVLIDRRPGKRVVLILEVKPVLTSAEVIDNIGHPLADRPETFFDSFDTGTVVLPPFEGPMLGLRPVLDTLVLEFRLEVVLLDSAFDISRD